MPCSSSAQIPQRTLLLPGGEVSQKVWKEDPLGVSSSQAQGTTVWVSVPGLRGGALQAPLHGDSAHQTETLQNFAKDAAGAAAEEDRRQSQSKPLCEDCLWLGFWRRGISPRVCFIRYTTILQNHLIHYELYILLLYVVDIDNFCFSLLAHYKLRIHFPKGAQSDWRDSKHLDPSKSGVSVLFACASLMGPVFCMFLPYTKADLSSFFPLTVIVCFSPLATTDLAYSLCQFCLSTFASQCTALEASAVQCQRVLGFFSTVTLSHAAEEFDCRLFSAVHSLTVATVIKKQKKKTSPSQSRKLLQLHCRQAKSRKGRLLSLSRPNRPTNCLPWLWPSRRFQLRRWRRLRGP